MRYQDKLTKLKRAVKAIYISSYIPRKCGLATYTKDLTTAINALNPEYLAKIIAVDEPGSDHNYPWEVAGRIQQNNRQSYLNIADFINQSCVEVVNIQHEFGLYGGKLNCYKGYSPQYLSSNQYLIDFLSRIKKPIVTTFHSILPNPAPRHRKIVRKIVALSRAVIVMVQSGVATLVRDYGIAEKKIVIIPHGVPDFPLGDSAPFKKKLKLGQRPIISTFGLINPGKGLEYVVRAMAEVVKKHPSAQFLVIGKTHPEVFKNIRESYRNDLKKLANNLKIAKSIKFIDEYLPLDDLIDYIKATDIYITPYLNPEQISSGTLAYAVGAGKACVSTPYIYAKEILADGRGILVNFKNVSEVASKINYLLSNPKKRQEIEKRAHDFGKMMTWHNVALRHLDLFYLIAKENKKIK